MLSIVLGNLFNLIGSAFNAYSSTRSSRKAILLVQEAAMACYVASGLFLQGYSGVVQNVVGMVRNVIAVYLPNDKFFGWVLVILGIVFGVYFNNLGFIGLFPVVCSVPFAIFAIRKDANALLLKIALTISNFGFLVYAFVTYNFVGMITNSFAIAVALISIYKDQLAKKETQAQAD
ncbi:MAG: YgjV family protein [Erysipelotrichaceae bacterium]|nr:YgjV family protein [Erysipelotrichaceae bacterium]